MVFLVKALEPLAGDVSINLRGREVTMPQEQLHHAEIGAVIEQVGRKGVPKPVGRDGPIDAGFQRVTLDP